MSDIGDQIVVYTLGAWGFFGSILTGAAALIVSLVVGLSASKPPARVQRALVGCSTLLAVQLVVGVVLHMYLHNSLMSIPIAFLIIAPLLTGLGILILLVAKRRAEPS